MSETEMETEPGGLSAEVRERLLGKNFWHLATLGADGAPRISPMWADMEGPYVMVNTSVGRVKEDNLRRDPRVSMSCVDDENPYDRVEIRGRVIRFVEGEEAERATDRLTRKYIGEERYPWLIPGERRLMLLIEPIRVRHVVGVEKFRPGALPQGDEAPAGR